MLYVSELYFDWTVTASVEFTVVGLMFRLPLFLLMAVAGCSKSNIFQPAGPQSDCHGVSIDGGV